MICDYGCGKEAHFILKNNKKCCNDNYRKCSAYIEKRIKKVIGKKRQKSIPINDNKLCDYCKENIAKYIFKNKKVCCQETVSKCPEIKRKNSLKNLSEKNHFFGKKHNSESLKKMSKSHLGIKKGPHTEEHKRKISNSWTPERRKEKRNYMLNGGIKHTYKFIKKISNEELRLKNLVSSIYPNCESQFKILRYFLDIALPEYKIAIEYDGYFHFDSEEHKEYHKQRQKEIEQEGWKFYRVTMFDKFPDLNEVKNNIEELIKI